MGESMANALANGQPRLRWLFLDLNSYFASVEQELRPELRGRPVAVVPLVADTTCCIAASYEAKKHGVRTGTRVGEAKRLCPGIVLVEARHEVYVDYHHRVVEAVESCVPVTSVMSIDEMACRLLGREQPLLSALELAREVKAAIRRKAGSTLCCSIGLAPNRYLAKVASDMEKPDGLVALTPDLLHDALCALTPRDLPGVGARMERRLSEQGIRTMAQLLSLDREKLHALWGSIGGEKLWYWLRGEDFGDPELEHQKSIGHSHVLPPELRTPEGVHAVAGKLLHKSAMRLRKAQLWASKMTVTVRFAVRKEDSSSRHTSGIPEAAWNESVSLIECQDNQTLLEGLQRIWGHCPAGDAYQKPFFVGISLGNLVPDALHTLSLFSGLEEQRRRTQLAATMDRVNYKYGTNTLCFAGMLLAGAAAPTRIAFSSIPELF
ncbi:MAG TPA: DNA polymerase [Acidobacteriaceae bacterium]|nr:DNA polymerase [Acidobacteriaceae bacterium]